MQIPGVGPIAVSPGAGAGEVLAPARRRRRWRASSPWSCTRCGSGTLYSGNPYASAGEIRAETAAKQCQMLGAYAWGAWTLNRGECAATTSALHCSRDLGTSLGRWIRLARASPHL